MKIKDLKKFVDGQLKERRKISTLLKRVFKELSRELQLPPLLLYSFDLRSYILGNPPRRLLKIQISHSKESVTVYDGADERKWPAVVFKAKNKKYAIIPSRSSDNVIRKVKDLERFLPTLTQLVDDYLRTRELESFEKDINYILRIGVILNSALSEKVIMRRVMTYITELINAEAGSLLLIDRERGELFFEIALGEKGDDVRKIRLKIGEGIAGWVAQTGRSTIVNEPAKDKRWYRKADEKTKFHTRNILCVPVKVKGEVIAVMQALNKRTGDFNRYDERILKAFATQVGIALENARLYQELKKTFLETSEALATSIEARDPYTGGHTKRVVHYSVETARELGLAEDEIEKLMVAAILHDVGKIGIDDAVLRKQGKLNKEELALMRKHPEIGAEIISKVESLRDIVPAVLYHQESYDGTGYPEGLKDGEIPLFARIIAVADTFDAMTTDRPYRKALPDEVALNELERCAGTQFDPEVVKAFISAYKKGRIK